MIFKLVIDVILDLDANQLVIFMLSNEDYISNV